MYRIMTAQLPDQAISHRAIKAHNGQLPFIPGRAAVPAATEATVQLLLITIVQVQV
jgi:hypothetical protein